MSTKRNKPARWAYLDELDGRPTDNTPIRGGVRKPALWELCLYAVAAVLWGVALYALLAEKVGSTGLLLLGGAVLLLRSLLFELGRRRRCKASLLGTVESLTRRPYFRKNARYPVIRFEVNGQSFCAYGAKPCHPSTVGNEEWVRYNPNAPADCFPAADSKPLSKLLATAVTAFLGVALLLMELN